MRPKPRAPDHTAACHQTKLFRTLCLAWLLPGIFAALQPQTDAAQGGTIKTTSVGVNVYVIVEGRQGRIIRDLRKDEFELSEDGVRQKIEFFSRETEAALSLGVALDTSVSQQHLLPTEQEAAKKFLHSVLQHGDQAFVMNFDTDVKLLQDFCDQPGDLAKAIDAAEINSTGKSVLEDAAAPAASGTHLYDTVFLASNELMKTRYGRKALVLVTDGEDQGSKVNLLKATEAAEKADVIIYSIVISDPEFYTLMGSRYRGDASVRKLARETGGRTIRVKASEQIGAAFEQVARELRSQYLLGYSPSNAKADGAFRHIQVKVRVHNYTARTRTGYYARRDETAAGKDLNP